MTPPASLGERLELLEKERADLPAQVEVQKQRNADLARRLDELVQGTRPRRSLLRRLAWLGILAFLGTAGVTYCLVQEPGSPARPIRVVKDTIGPSLLVTSVPEAAMVRIEGELQGLTPVLVPLAPVARSYHLHLEAAGFAPVETQVEVKATQGAHVHHILSPVKP